MKNPIFRIKYKLGVVKEGKDSFTCGFYQFCKDCKESNRPCNKYLNEQDGINYLKPGYEEIVKMKNSIISFPGKEKIKRSLEGISWWKVKKLVLKKL
ncbi:MAG: hypothetical protein H2184_15635 [Candidatus Galacturonibacter soehngenii]|nr:hypothetical protein [Candidatus Galacturonibacter soehngenii]